MNKILQEQFRKEFPQGLLRPVNEFESEDATESVLDFLDREIQWAKELVFKRVEDDIIRRFGILKVGEPASYFDLRQYDYACHLLDIIKNPSNQ